MIESDNPTPQQAHDELRRGKFRRERTTKWMRRRAKEAVVIVGDGEAQLRETAVFRTHAVRLLFMSDGSVQWTGPLLREIQDE